MSEGEMTVTAVLSRETSIVDRYDVAYPLTRDDVELMATRLPKSEASRGVGRVWAEVNGEFFPAVDLVVPLTVRSDAQDYFFRLSDLERALGELGFAVVRRSRRPGRHLRPEPSVRTAQRRDADVEEPFVPGAYTAATAERMGAYVGKWIGVREDQIVAVGETAEEVLDATEGSLVSLIHVPERSLADADW